MSASLKTEGASLELKTRRNRWWKSRAIPRETHCLENRTAYKYIKVYLVVWPAVSLNGSNKKVNLYLHNALWLTHCSIQFLISCTTLIPFTDSPVLILKICSLIKCVLLILSYGCYHRSNPTSILFKKHNRGATEQDGTKCKLNLNPHFKKRSLKCKITTQRCKFIFNTH